METMTTIHPPTQYENGVLTADNSNLLFPVGQSGPEVKESEGLFGYEDMLANLSGCFIYSGQLYIRTSLADLNIKCCYYPNSGMLFRRYLDELLQEYPEDPYVLNLHYQQCKTRTTDRRVNKTKNYTSGTYRVQSNYKLSLACQLGSIDHLTALTFMKYQLTYNDFPIDSQPQLKHINQQQLSLYLITKFNRKWFSQLAQHVEDVRTKLLKKSVRNLKIKQQFVKELYGTKFRTIDVRTKDYLEDYKSTVMKCTQAFWCDDLKYTINEQNNRLNHVLYKGWSTSQTFSYSPYLSISLGYHVIAAPYTGSCAKHCVELCQDGDFTLSDIFTTNYIEEDDPLDLQEIAPLMPFISASPEMMPEIKDLTQCIGLGILSHAFIILPVKYTDKVSLTTKFTFMKPGAYFYPFYSDYSLILQNEEYQKHIKKYGSNHQPGLQLTEQQTDSDEEEDKVNHDQQLGFNVNRIEVLHAQPETVNQPRDIPRIHVGQVQIDWNQHFRYKHYPFTPDKIYRAWNSLESVSVPDQIFEQCLYRGQERELIVSNLTEHPGLGFIYKEDRENNMLTYVPPATGNHCTLMSLAFLQYVTGYRHVALSTVIPWDILFYCTQTNRLENINRRYFQAYNISDSENEDGPFFITCNQTLQPINMQQGRENGDYQLTEQMWQCHGEQCRKYFNVQQNTDPVTEKQFLDLCSAYYSSFQGPNRIEFIKTGENMYHAVVRFQFNIFHEYRRFGTYDISEEWLNVWDARTMNRCRPFNNEYRSTDLSPNEMLYHLSSVNKTVIIKDVNDHVICSNILQHVKPDYYLVYNSTNGQFEKSEWIQQVPVIPQPIHPLVVQEHNNRQVKQEEQKTDRPFYGYYLEGDQFIADQRVMLKYKGKELTLHYFHNTYNPKLATRILKKDLPNFLHHSLQLLRLKAYEKSCDNLFVTGYGWNDFLQILKDSEHQGEVSLMKNLDALATYNQNQPVFKYDNIQLTEREQDCAGKNFIQTFPTNFVPGNFSSSILMIPQFDQSQSHFQIFDNTGFIQVHGLQLIWDFTTHRIIHPFINVQKNETTFMYEQKQYVRFFSVHVAPKFALSLFYCDQNYTPVLNAPPIQVKRKSTTINEKIQNILFEPVITPVVANEQLQNVLETWINDPINDATYKSDKYTAVDKAFTYASVLINQNPNRSEVSSVLETLMNEKQEQKYLDLANSVKLSDRVYSVVEPVFDRIVNTVKASIALPKLAGGLSDYYSQPDSVIDKSLPFVKHLCFVPVIYAAYQYCQFFFTNLSILLILYFSFGGKKTTLAFIVYCFIKNLFLKPEIFVSGQSFVHYLESYMQEIILSNIGAIHLFICNMFYQTLLSIYLTRIIYLYMTGHAFIKSSSQNSVTKIRNLYLSMKHSFRIVSLQNALKNHINTLFSECNSAIKTRVMRKQHKQLYAGGMTNVELQWADILEGKSNDVPLSQTKLTELWNADYFNSFSLVKMVITTGEKLTDLIQRFVTEPFRAKTWKYSTRYDTKLKRIRAPKCSAPHPLAVLWCLICRQIAAKVTPNQQDLKELLSHQKLYSQQDIMRSVQVLKDEFLTQEQYLASIEPSKRSAYARGFEKFKKRCKINTAMTFFQKTKDFFHLKSLNSNDLKPRGINNPDDTVKGPLGHVMNALMKCSKWLDQHTPRFEGDFRYRIGSNCLGLTPYELEQRINQAAHSFSEPFSFVASDGSNHDSHQHHSFIDQVDNQILQNIDPIIAQLGYNRYEAKEIKRAITELETTVNIPTPRQGKINDDRRRITTLIKLKLKGTVFSGHPSRTSWGNTTRMLHINYSLAKKFGYIQDYHCFMAGDDCLELIADKHLPLLQEAKSRYWAKPDQIGPYGAGMVLKELVISKDQFSFLSKVGSINNGKYSLKRQVHRVVGTGSSTNKDTLTIQQLDASVRSQLSAYIDQDDPLYSWLKEWVVDDVHIKENYDPELQYKIADMKSYVIRTNPDELSRCKLISSMGGLIYSTSVQ